MNVKIGLTTFAAAALAFNPAAAQIGCGISADFPCKETISVFGPIQIGPPIRFGRADEPDTRWGQQLLILNDGEFVIQAMETGAFYGKSNGQGRADYAWRSAENKNYPAVNCSYFNCNTDRGPEESANNFFVFDLSGVDVSIVRASLSLGNGPMGINGGPFTYRLYDVRTPFSRLLGDFPAVSHVNAIDVYNDLMGGQKFGEIRFNAAQNGSQIQMELNGRALWDINAALGGNWAIGGAAVPEPASWWLLITGFGLTGARLRRRHGQADDQAFPSRNATSRSRQRR